MTPGPLWCLSSRDAPEELWCFDYPTVCCVALAATVVVLIVLDVQRWRR